MRAICIASGPSLTREDVDACRGHGRVYVVKESRHLAPWADVLYAADLDWWLQMQGCQDFAGERWTCNDIAAKGFCMNYIEVDKAATWCVRDKVASGGNSGFQAMNLAYLHGATEIVLLGYDMGFTGKKKHWYDGGEHDRPSRLSNYEAWIRHFNRAAPLIDIPVYNASRLSALECFERKSLHECLHGAG